jgi:hypothetical protein
MLLISGITTFVVLLIMLLAVVGTFTVSGNNSFLSCGARLVKPHAAWEVPGWEAKSGMDADFIPETTFSQRLNLSSATHAFISLCCKCYEVFVRALLWLKQLVVETYEYVLSLFACAPPQSRFFFYVLPQTAYCEAYNTFYQVPVQTSLHDKILLVLLAFLCSLSATLLAKIRSPVMFPNPVLGWRAFRSKEKIPVTSDNNDVKPDLEIGSDGQVYRSNQSAQEEATSGCVLRPHTPFCDPSSPLCNRTRFGRCQTHDSKEMPFGRSPIEKKQGHKLLTGSLERYRRTKTIATKGNRQPVKFGGRNSWKLQKASREQFKALKTRERNRLSKKILVATN